MLLVDTFVGPSVIEGVGVFAAEPIKAGQIVYRFEPCFDRLIARAELDAYPDSIRRFLNRYTYPHPTERLMVVLDADNGRHMNHSLEPNTDFSHSIYGFAIRDIAVGEEITCNYTEFEPDFQMLPSLVTSCSKSSEEKGTFYFFRNDGLPRGRSEDSSPSRAAVFVCQCVSPNGVPRARLCRRALSSASVSTPLTWRIH